MYVYFLLCCGHIEKKIIYKVKEYQVTQIVKVRFLNIVIKVLKNKDNLFLDSISMWNFFILFEYSAIQ